MSHYDAIIVGAGTNGLACAATLATRGLKVLVLEKRDVVGGLAATEEFHSGYKVPGLLHDTTGVRDSVIENLRLREHGLARRATRPDVVAVHAGQTRVVPGDVAHADRLPGDDARAFREYHAFIDRVSGVLDTYLNEAPVNLVDLESLPYWELIKRGLRLRSLGREEMLELMRLPPMCVADWLNEWFDDEMLKAAMSVPAVAGTWCGPWSPGTNANLLLWEAAAGGDVTHLAESLERACLNLKVEIRTGSEVASILSGDRVQGVKLADGAELKADIVASACDPFTSLIGLLQPSAITFRLEQRIHNFRARGTTAQVVLALNGPLSIEGYDGQAEYVRTGGHLDDVERAFDAVKYRAIPEHPILDIHVPTVQRPELAPDGHHVANIHVHFTPHALEGGWDDGARERLSSVVLDELERHVPGVRDQVVHVETRTPADIERIYGTRSGHIHHGEHALDQLLVRPAPEVSQYATPVPGLFLCGAGCHPGGGLNLAPGSLAAEAILAR